MLHLSWLYSSYLSKVSAILLLFVLFFGHGGQICSSESLFEGNGNCWLHWAIITRLCCVADSFRLTRLGRFMTRLAIPIPVWFRIYTYIYEIAIASINQYHRLSAPPIGIAQWSNYQNGIFSQMNWIRCIQPKVETEAHVFHSNYVLVMKHLVICSYCLPRVTASYSSLGRMCGIGPAGMMPSRELLACIHHKDLDSCEGKPLTADIMRVRLCQ